MGGQYATAVGVKSLRGPLMDQDGTQRNAKLGNKYGSKHKREVNAGRKNQRTIEWLRAWRLL
jgi:hypothetical protein